MTVKDYAILIGTFLLIMGIMIISFGKSGNVNITTADGTSMEPSIKDRSYIFAVKPNDLERFDVIIFDFDSLQSEYEGNKVATGSIKRIVGMPGDTLTFSGNSLRINDDSYDLKEPVIQPSSSYLIGKENKDSVSITLGDDEYFIMGDNTLHSIDSRAFGPIKYESISYKVKKDYDYPFTLSD